MQPTESLIQEHRVILRVLACLERVLDDAVRHGRIDERDAGEALEFFGTFAFGYHDRKEEEHLFPEARRAAPGDLELSTRELEHHVGREGLRGMRESFGGAAAGDMAALSAFLNYGRNFAAGWRAHIATEERELFPAIDAALGEHGRALVERGFRDAAQRLPPGELERLLALGRRLCARLDVPVSGSAADGGRRR